MSKLYRLINLVFTFITILLLSIGCSYVPLKEGFANLPYQGIVVPISGNISINQSGGHIQGIQMHQEGIKKEVFLSGSSAEVAFIVRAEIDGKAGIISADTLLLDPYRHAGGFQIHEQYLAIGIEDNKLRNTSRVMVYDLNKEAVLSDPVQMIQRDGEFQRVTAGAVGMTSIHDHYLIAVANWDSRNIDIYIYPEGKFLNETEEFHLIGSLDMESISRKNWIEPTWRSYQNINLFTDSDNRLYLVGFATTGNGENVADLYSMDFNKGWFSHPDQVQKLEDSFSLTKVASRKFETMANTRFRWGAGMYRDQDGEFTIIASPEHIEPSTSMVLYSR